MGSLNQKSRAGIPVDPKVDGWGRLVAQVVNGLLIGRTNNTGTLTLKANGVSTSVSDARCGASSVVLLAATSATGAAGLTTWHLSNVTDGAFTITHVSTSTSDATAKYALLG